MRHILFRVQLVASVLALTVLRPHGRHAAVHPTAQHRLRHLRRRAWHPVRTITLTVIATLAGLFALSAIVGSALSGAAAVLPAPSTVLAAPANAPAPVLAAPAVTKPVAAPAVALPTETVGQYHLPLGKRICIQDNGWTRWNDVLPNIAWRLRSHGITDVVVWDNCSSQPASQVVRLATSNDPNSYYCARTERGAYVNGVATGQTIIRVNLASNWYGQCLSNWGQRAHVMSHEVGHAFGLVHSTGDSVMAPSRFDLAWFTAADYTNLGRIYALPLQAHR